MADAPPDMVLAPDERATADGAIDDDPRAERSWTGAAIMLLIAVALFAVLSLPVLPDKLPIAIGLPQWRGFCELVLRDTLWAAALLAIGVAIACLRIGPMLWLERLIFRSRLATFLIVTSLFAAATSIWFCYDILDHVPHVQDEIAMVFQARNFASGQLYAKAPSEALKDFFDYEFLVMDHGRWYGKYFFGPSLLLLPGVFFGLEWLMNPLLGGLSILLFYGLGRELLGEKVGRLIALLAAISPFRMSIFALMMSHGGCLSFAMLFAWAFIKGARNPQRYRYWIIAGIAAGMMLNFRPLTGLALGVPVAIAAVLVLRWRQVTAGSLLAYFVPLILFIGLFLGYNYALTGDYTLTPFTVWSPNDHLGFGRDVGMDYWPRYDRGLTIQGAFNNVFMNLHAMVINLAGWWRVTTLLMLASLLLVWRRPVFLLAWASFLALAIAYFFYHASGTLAGQARYWSEAMAFMFILLIGGIAVLRMALAWAFRRFGWRLPDVRARASLWAAGLMLTVWGGYLAVWGSHAGYRGLVDECGEVFWGQGPMLRDAIARGEVTDGIVFIPSNYYRETGIIVDDYAAGAALNWPNLDTPVLFVRDRGDERDQLILDQYPNRPAYRFLRDPNGTHRFEPIPRHKAP